MVAHVVLITWGYAAGSVTAAPATLWDLVVNYPGMLLAAAATLCLVMVVATSIRAARRGSATSRGTSCTSTPTSASGSRSRTSSGPGRLHLLAWPPGLLVDRVGGVRRERAGVARRAAGLAQRAPRPQGDRRRARGSRRLVGLRHRTASCTGSRRGRTVPHLAVPRAAGVDARQPVLALGRPGRAGLRITVQDVGDGSGAAPGLDAGLAGPGRGPVRAPQPPRAATARVAASAPASGSPRCVPSPRDATPGDAVIFQRCPTSRCSPTAPRPGPRPRARSSGHPRPPSRTDSWLGHRVKGSTTPPC